MNLRDTKAVYRPPGSPSHRKGGWDCSALTEKGYPCPIDADRQREGVWYCHLHDPLGEYQMQVQATISVTPVPGREARAT